MKPYDIIQKMYEKLLHLISQEKPTEDFTDYVSSIEAFRKIADEDAKAENTRALWNDCKSTLNIARQKAGFECK